MSALSPIAIMAYMAGVIGFAAVKKTDCFSSFASGAKQGISTTLRVMPYMAAMLVAISVMRASGLLDALIALFSPLAKAIGLPPEALPVAMIRPFSGSGALAALAETLYTYGADSRIGRAACIIMGSSETLFYLTSIYFGSVGIKKWRHTVPAGLIAWLAGVIMAAFLA